MVPSLLGTSGSSRDGRNVEVRPTSTMVTLSRPVMSDLEVLERLVGPSSKEVVDIGCGGGALVRALTARGAKVIGVEVNEEQLAPALRSDDGGSGARYLIGPAHW